MRQRWTSWAKHLLTRPQFHFQSCWKTRLNRHPSSCGRQCLATGVLTTQELTVSSTPPVLSFSSRTIPGEIKHIRDCLDQVGWHEEKLNVLFHRILKLKVPKRCPSPFSEGLLAGGYLRIYCNYHKSRFGVLIPYPAVETTADGYPPWVMCSDLTVVLQHPISLAHLVYFPLPKFFPCRGLETLALRHSAPCILEGINFLCLLSRFYVGVVFQIGTETRTICRH